jgi:hypothetical protein
MLGAEPLARQPNAIVSEHKISTTIGHYVRGFQGCQAVSNSINSFFFGFL